MDKSDLYGLLYEGPPPREFWGLILVVGLFACLLLARILYEIWRNRRGRVETLRRIAAEHAAERGLIEEEAALFERIVLGEKNYPSLAGFERQVEKLLAGGTSPDIVGVVRVKMGYARVKEGRPLASTRECEVGQEIAVSSPPHVFRATIVDLDETVLVAKVPAEAIAQLKSASAVEVSFWRDFDARYYFRAKVQGMRARPAPFLFLEHPARIERFQDREHVRAEVGWRIPITRLTEEEYRKALRMPIAPDAVEGYPMQAHVLDISAGGLRLEPIRDLPAEARVIVEIPSSERKGPMVLLARVIVSDDKNVRCEFEGISENERDEIHRQILRERRRKENA